MNQLEDFYNPINHKSWLIKLLPVDCDIIHIIKKLLYYVIDKRIIKPLTMKAIKDHYVKGCCQYSYTGADVLFFISAYHGQYYKNCDITTSIYCGSISITEIHYKYRKSGHFACFMLNYNRSKCHRMQIIPLNLIKPLELYRWNHFDYPVEFITI